MKVYLKMAEILIDIYCEVFAVVFLVGAFEEKCRNLTVGSFLYGQGPHYSSFVQQFDLRMFKTPETREPRPKQTKPTSRTSKTY